MIAVVAMRTPYEPLRKANARLSHFLEWVNIHRFYHCKNCVINNCFKVLVHWLLRPYAYLYLAISIYLENKLSIYYMFTGECMNRIIMVFIRYAYILMLYTI